MGSAYAKTLSGRFTFYHTNWLLDSTMDNRLEDAYRTISPMEAQVNEIRL